jgi:hypothetical protein
MICGQEKIVNTFWKHSEMLKRYLLAFIAFSLFLFATEAKTEPISGTNNSMLENDKIVDSLSAFSPKLFITEGIEGLMNKALQDYKNAMSDKEKETRDLQVALAWFHLNQAIIINDKYLRDLDKDSYSNYNESAIAGLTTICKNSFKVNKSRCIDIAVKTRAILSKTSSSVLRNK